MDTEFRDRLSAAIFDANDRGQFAADAVLALLPPPDVLSWVSAHPEAAKGLAEGTSALAAIAAERQRQTEQEGWTPEHDDQHTNGSLARAAACYALGAVSVGGTYLWPWQWEWWKPTDERRNLVKAGALIAAEIERLDRLAASTPVPSDEAQGER